VGGTLATLVADKNRAIAEEDYDKREFGIKDIGKWIVGEEDLFKSIFKQHAETVQNIIKEKAVA
jgi:hypothetical protein